MTEDQVVSPALDSIPRIGARGLAGAGADPRPEGRPAHPGPAPGAPRRPGAVPDDEGRRLLGPGGPGRVAARRVDPIARRRRTGAADAGGGPLARSRPLRPSRCRRRPPPPVAEPDYEPVDSRWDLPFPRRSALARAGASSIPTTRTSSRATSRSSATRVFLVFTGVLDAPSESRRLPVPSGVSTRDPATLRVLRRGSQLFTTPRALLSARALQGPDRLPARRRGRSR